MSELGYKCPKCGQDEWVVAHALIITGPIDVSEDGMEPRYGKGLNYEVPADAMMHCPTCGHNATASDFGRTACEAWWNDEED